MTIPKATDFIKSQMAEGVKTYSVYDGSNRLSDVYTAMVDTEHGEQCIRTQYTYYDSTTRIKQTKESLATWNSSWDI